MYANILKSYVPYPIRYIQYLQYVHSLWTSVTVSQCYVGKSDAAVAMGLF